jgi:site-specific DNA-adenine methylase
MSKNHFPFSYKGNKRNETDNIINNIDFKNKKNIVEPFTGSSAMSFAIWKKYGNQFNYYLNDIDSRVVEVHNLLRNETIQNIEENVNRVRRDVLSQQDKKEFHKSINQNNRDIYDYIYVSKYCMRGLTHLCYTDTEKWKNEKRLLTSYKFSPSQLQFIDFIKSPNVFITNNDYKIIYEEHKNNPKSIILLDPPYVNSDKSFYHSNDTEIYTYLSNNPIKKNKASIYVIVDDNWIMRIVFKDTNVLSVYDKSYEIIHRQVKHVIFSNK